jgi:hypothetical protein
MQHPLVVRMAYKPIAVLQHALFDSHPLSDLFMSQSWLYELLLSTST